MDGNGTGNRESCSRLCMWLRPG